MQTLKKIFQKIDANSIVLALIFYIWLLFTISMADTVFKYIMLIISAGVGISTIYYNIKNSKK